MITRITQDWNFQRVHSSCDERQKIHGLDEREASSKNTSRNVGPEKVVWRQTRCVVRAKLHKAVYTIQKRAHEIFGSLHHSSSWYISIPVFIENHSVVVIWNQLLSETRYRYRWLSLWGSLNRCWTRLERENNLAVIGESLETNVL